MKIFSFDYAKMSLEALLYHFEVYGDHDAAIEICNREFISSEAENYAKKVRNMLTE